MLFSLHPRPRASARGYRISLVTRVTRRRSTGFQQPVDLFFAAVFLVAGAVLYLLFGYCSSAAMR